MHVTLKYFLFTLQFWSFFIGWTIEVTQNTWSINYFQSLMLIRWFSSISAKWNININILNTFFPLLFQFL